MRSTSCWAACCRPTPSPARSGDRGDAEKRTERTIERMSRVTSEARERALAEDGEVLVTDAAEERPDDEPADQPAHHAAPPAAPTGPRPAGGTTPPPSRTPPPTRRRRSRPSPAAVCAAGGRSPTTR